MCFLPGNKNVQGAAVESVKQKLMEYLVCPKRGKNHKKKKMGGLCFVLNALLIVPGVENVSINKSFVVQCVENIHR